MSANVALLTAHRLFVSACAGDRGFAATASTPHCREWEVFTMENAGGNKVGFRSYHGKWLCAEENGNVVANRDGRGGWETMELVPLGDGWYAIRSFHGGYLSVDPGSNNFHCRAPGVGGNERFRIVLNPPIGLDPNGAMYAPAYGASYGPGGGAGASVQSGNVAFLTAHRLFISALPADHGFGAVAGTPQCREWEVFNMESAGGNKVGFRGYHGKWLCAEESGNIVANRDGRGGWETFDLQPLGDGWFALRTFHGRYLSVDPGSNNLHGNASGPGPNERFRLVSNPSIGLDPNGAMYAPTIGGGAGGGGYPSGGGALQSGSVGLFTAHRLFVSACGADRGWAAVAGTPQLREWEQFYMEVVGGNKVAFRSHHGKWLCAEENGNVIANRDARGPWETYDLQPLGDGWFALHTCHNTYLSVDPGSNNFHSRARGAGPNERFRILTNPPVGLDANGAAYAPTIGGSGGYPGGGPGGFPGPGFPGGFPGPAPFPAGVPGGFPFPGGVPFPGGPGHHHHHHPGPGRW